MKRYITLISPGLLSFLGLFSPLGTTGIGAITLSPFIISRRKMSEVNERHEAIHVYQQQECSLVLSALLSPFLFVSPWFGVPIALFWVPFIGPFYWLYAFFYIWGLMKYRGVWKNADSSLDWNDSSTLGEFAYCQIPFEQEAYENEEDKLYLEYRKSFGWIRYKI